MVLVLRELITDPCSIEMIAALFQGKVMGLLVLHSTISSPTRSSWTDLMMTTKGAQSGALTTVAKPSSLIQVRHQTAARLLECQTTPTTRTI